VNINEDSVIIYKFQTEKVLEKDHIGIKKAEPSFVI